jgi:hypothetical protein
MKLASSAPAESDTTVAVAPAVSPSDENWLVILLGERSLQSRVGSRRPTCHLSVQRSRMLREGSAAWQPCTTEAGQAARPEHGAGVLGARWARCPIAMQAGRTKLSLAQASLAWAGRPLGQPSVLTVRVAAPGIRRWQFAKSGVAQPRGGSMHDSGAHYRRTDLQVHSPRDAAWKGPRPSDPSARRA